MRSVLSLARCRKLLLKEDRDISDRELELLRDHLTSLAAVTLDLREKKPPRQHVSSQVRTSHKQLVQKDVTGTTAIGKKARGRTIPAKRGSMRVHALVENVVLEQPDQNADRRGHGRKGSSDD